ncbi:MAG: NADH-quinone oxidoreductase subunit K [Elusimicrobiota bacterium]
MIESHALADAVMALLLITNLLLLGFGYLNACVRAVALQGLVVGLLPLIMGGGSPLWRVAALTAVGMGIKGVVFPRMLSKLLRDVEVRREVEPFVGHGLSIALGVGAMGFSLWVSSKLGPLVAARNAWMISAGLATLLVGLFLIVSRRKAVSQVLGYIVLENGVYTFGLATVGHVPLLVELGVLMDAFVAVFIMSIAAYHISREFNHMDVDLLDKLRD